jgi:hypothetical protein
MVFMDTLESITGAEMWRNIPHYQNKIKSSVPLQFLRILKPTGYVMHQQG